MNTLPYSDIPAETVKRIMIAADQLYEEGGKKSLPNVDAVRRRARVNMNDASNVMRAWRREHTTPASPLAVAIPPQVQEAGNALLEGVWNAAVTRANESLLAAQSGWELERAEADACRRQLASAFDQQSEELTTVCRSIETLERQLADQAADLIAWKVDRDTLASRERDAIARSANAEARTEEVLKRIDDLKSELKFAHDDARHERADATQRLDAAHAMIRELNEQLRKGVDNNAAALTELSRLRGQLETKTAELDALLERKKPNGDARAPAKAKTIAKPKPAGRN